MANIAENALFTQEVPDKGACNGHVRFVLTSARPEDIALVGFIANVTTALLFDRLEPQGTNIIVQLEQHKARVEVLARNENDGLNLLWTPKPADAAQLDASQERIRNKTFFIGKENDEKKDGKKEETASEKPEEKITTKTVEHTENLTPRDIPPAAQDLSEAEEDYLVKQLHRIP